MCRTLLAVALLLAWRMSVAHSTDARCGVYPAAADHTDVMIPCTFSLRQGSGTIWRSKGSPTS